MKKIIALLAVLLALVSCKWGMGSKEEATKEQEAPVIESLKDSGLPCLKCHPFDKFAAEKPGGFSHQKHLGFGVHCNQCHIIKPHNEKEMLLNKETCNGCHNMKSFTFAGAGMPVNFNHDNHTKKYPCAVCHPSPFQMKRGSTRITMEEMYKGNTCGKCHNGKLAFSAKDCTKCHAMSSIKKDFSYPSGDMSPAIFSHQVHTAMFECSKCHTALFKYKKGGSGMKMDALYQNKFCGSCHDGKTAFGTSECQKCHK